MDIRNLAGRETATYSYLVCYDWSEAELGWCLSIENLSTGKVALTSGHKTGEAAMAAATKHEVNDGK